ncbi:yqcG [Bacillus sp. M 2-6]|nr:yqcG [Bacillus sp. M 2-6]
MGIKNAKSIVKDQKKALKTIFQDIDDLISLEVFRYLIAKPLMKRSKMRKMDEKRQ